LNKETEIPIETVQVSKHALNKVRWNQNSKHLAVAVSDGSLQIYNTGEVIFSFFFCFKFFVSIFF